ncbi:hypothetical protein JI735_29200 [Paenibacillus sonchi]|uniref:Uncharacterized protein n=1 Tax=Paenibacillus sonchi TaxID=373687 RepID=A0A974SC58_9BACL|nr:hypothetical protein [Paenibacillus sonchi]QQZ60522.1 hypothetical protein JI735_29200 [Paenibacillus sonchi]
MKMVFDPFKSQLIKWMMNKGWKLFPAITGILVGVVAAEMRNSNNQKELKRSVNENSNYSNK